MQARWEEIRRMGAGVLVISFEPAARLAMYREAHGWPFPVVSDSGRRAYREMGLGEAGWRRLLGLGVLRRYAELMRKGYRPSGSGGADVHQLGGDFVIDSTRRLVYAHRSMDPADRPTVSEWLSALERASRPSPDA